MKLLALQGSTPAVATARRPKLPRDATVQFNHYPAELYLNMTITRIEHIHALMDSLNTFAHQLVRDEDTP